MCFFTFGNPVRKDPDDPQFVRKKDLLEAHIQIGLFLKVTFSLSLSLFMDGLKKMFF